MGCSIARALDVIGEWWTPLILRDVFLGLTRFEELQRDLGLARNILADRLDTLVGGGVLERRPYQDRPVRHAYVLTAKGRDLLPVLLTLQAWGDRWTAGAAGPPLRLRHDPCGRVTTPVAVCAHCRQPLAAADLTALPGPGGRAARGTLLVGQQLPRRLAG